MVDTRALQDSRVPGYFWHRPREGNKMERLKSKGDDRKAAAADVQGPDGVEKLRRDRGTGSTIHKQVFAKVNAPVDEEIKMLVQALSAFPSLCTTQSCQGPPARIWFYYGHERGFREMTDFVLGELGAHIKRRVFDGADVSVNLDQLGKLSCLLTVDEDVLMLTTNAIRELAERMTLVEDFKSAAYHKSGF